MNKLSRYEGVLASILSVVMFMMVEAKAFCKGAEETETPASSVVQDSYRGAQVGDFYISPNIAFGLAKLSKPSMTGFNMFFVLDIDHLSDGNLDILSSDNAFAFRSVEYGLGILSVSKDDEKMSFFIPAQFLYKRSFGMQASKSGILSMIKIGVGPLLATSITLETDKSREETDPKDTELKVTYDNWAFGLTAQLGYELSLPISYISAVNMGMQWNFSVIDIDGTLSVKGCKTPGHFIYNAMMIYGGVRFSL